MRPPNQGALVQNQKSQAIQIGPSAANGGLLFELLLVELGLAARQEVPPEEAPDEGSPGGQNEMVSKPGSAAAVSQVVKTARVWPCLEDTDGRFLPSSMGRGETLVSFGVLGCTKVAPEDENWCPPVKGAKKDVSFIADEDWKWGDIEYGRWTNQFDDIEDPKDIVALIPNTATCFAVFDAKNGYWPLISKRQGNKTSVDPKYFTVFDVASGHWQIPFDKFDGARRWAFHNLPPNRWYQVVQECCDVEGFSGNFRLIMDKRTWWESQHVQNVNIRQIRHASITDRRGFGGDKMAESFIVYDCVQNNGEPVDSWLIRAASPAVKAAFREAHTARQEEPSHIVRK